jgi:DNA-binding MarR family transcriptional regulator
MDSSEHLIVPIWQAFVWLDEGLQNFLKLKGWPEVTRPQSMVMTNVALGIRRPSYIARNLGVSRQAIHVTIRQMVDLNMLVLTADPDDGRSKIVEIADTGLLMRETAREAMRLLAAELRRRIGGANVDHLQSALSADWGEPMDWTSDSMSPTEWAVRATA